MFRERSDDETFQTHCAGFVSLIGARIKTVKADSHLRVPETPRAIRISKRNNFERGKKNVSLITERAC